MSWEPLKWATLPERAPVRPSIGGLVYPGRRHAFSGPPETAKTWAAFCLGLDEIRRGGVVLHIDFEMFAYETRERLRAMGASPTELEQFLHVEPETAADEALIAAIVVEWAPTLVIIDAAAGAYDLLGLDDNKRQDAETFARVMVEPFRARDVATILLDHVTKNAESRGRFSIGSERKIGSADVHLGFEVLDPVGRGLTGLVRIAVHKDRFGYLPRPYAAELEVRSDPDTHAVTWSFRAPGDELPELAWQPTGYMEKVSRFLEAQTEPVSRNRIEKNVPGKDEFKRKAMDALRDGGYAKETKVGNARLLASLHPFREADLARLRSAP